MKSGRLGWAAFLTLAVLVSTTGCVQQMANQPRYEALERRPLGDDLQPPRQPVANTVARGQLRLDEHFDTGRVGGEPATSYPQRLQEIFPSTEEMLARGQNRYTAFCSHCHGMVGGGLGGSEEMRSLVGMVVQRGFPTPPTFHQQRLREVAPGHIFDVISNGLGRMPAHDYLLKPADRWAIVAYVQALQQSQHTESSSLSSQELANLQQTDES